MESPRLTRLIAPTCPQPLALKGKIGAMPDPAEPDQRAEVTS